MSAEDFQKKVSISEGEIEIERGGSSSSSTGVASRALVLLRRLLEIQERRAQAYAKLKRFHLFCLLVTVWDSLTYVVTVSN